MYYEQQGAGKPILLLHGWGCDSSFMRPVATRLSDRFQTLCLDFPGHGQSGHPPEPWGVPEYAEALHQLLERLEYCPCAVIAHSFGARVATWLASQDRNALFTKIILTGAAGIRPPQSETSRKKAEAYQRGKRISQALEKTGIFAPAALMLRKKLQQRYGSADYNALDDEMKKTFVKVISLDLLDCYERIQQPTLLMWGDQDTETPLWMGYEMEKRIPDAGMVVLEGGTHFAYLEQIDRFTAIVRHFLTEAEAT